MPPLIRLAEPTDTRQMLSMYIPLVLNTAIWFESKPPTEDEFRQRISARLEQAPWLVCESEGTVLGYAYGGTYRSRPAYQWTSEVAVNVHEGYRRRGIGRGLYTSLFECLRALSYVSAVAVITLPNPASVALHESLGFEPVGVFRSVGYKLGKWHDRGWWQLSLQLPCPSPSPPRRLPDVIDTPEWEAAMQRGIDVVRIEG